MSGRMRIDTKVKVRPVSKLELRAQSAGELVANLGGCETDADIASRGVLRQAWREIRIEAVDPVSGRVRDRATLHIDWTDDHRQMVSIEDDNGKSMLERCDGGLAELVARTADRFRRKGLNLEVIFYWAPGITDERKAELRSELGTQPTYERVWEEGYEPRQVASLRPGKDTGSQFQVWWGRRG